MRRLLALLLVCGLSACAGSRHAVRGAPRTLVGVAPRHLPGFEALRNAVEAREDATARRIAAGLRARVELERDLGVDGDATRNALDLLDGFDRILEGRALVDSLELELVVRESDGPAAEVVLRARTTRATRIELRPGAAELRVHRVTLSVTDGKEARGVVTQGVGGLEALALDSQGWAEVALGRFPTVLPGNALASRTRFGLTLRAGTVVEEGRALPAMDVPEVVAERVDLAPYLPTAPVEPAELAAYAARGDGSFPALLERTVRILPERRAEALDLLTPVVRPMTPEQITRLVPTLRWLAPTGYPGRDPEAWRRWLEARARSAAEPGGGGALEFGVDR